MVSVEEIISQLLLQHNCVIVPGFGGFVAQRMPALIDRSNGIIHPPSKALMFNRLLINNDGLLAQAYARKNEIPFDHALSTLQHLVSYWEQNLKDGARIAIDKVGIIYRDSENQICFEQDRFSNLLLQSFGLKAVHFVSKEDIVAQENKIQIEHEILKISTLEEPNNISNSKILVQFDTDNIEHPVNETIENSEPQIVSIHKVKSKTWQRIAAAAIVLPICFYSFWIPLKTDVLESGMISMHDFNPFHQRKLELYKAPSNFFSEISTKNVNQLAFLPETGNYFSLRWNDDVYVAVDLNRKSKIQKSIDNEFTKSSAAETFKGNSKQVSGQIIVGSYSSNLNAQGLVDEMKSKGLNAVILEMEGKYRVSAGEARDFQKIKLPLENAGLSPWILK